MQEKTAPAMVIFTVNNIEKVPIELMRKGRVDEIFYLDLPSYLERRDIFRIHTLGKPERAKSFSIPPSVSSPEFESVWNEIYLKKLEIRRGKSTHFKGFEEWKNDLIARHSEHQDIKNTDFNDEWWLYMLADDISAGFVGSEIEFGIIEAMYSGFSNAEGDCQPRKYTIIDIMDKVMRQTPLAYTFKESIDRLRKYLTENRVKSASFDEIDKSFDKFVNLN